MRKNWTIPVTPQGTNISPLKVAGKIILLFHMLVSQEGIVFLQVLIISNRCEIGLGFLPLSLLPTSTENFETFRIQNLSDFHVQPPQASHHASGKVNPQNIYQIVMLGNSMWNLLGQT